MKNLSILFVMLGFITLAPQAFAEDGVAPTTTENSSGSNTRFDDIREDREDLREKMQEEREKLRGQVEDKRGKLEDLRDEKREAYDKFKTERKEILSEMMKKKLERRLNSSIERLRKLSDRIQSRIEKVKAAGGVVTTVETQMAEAKVAYEAAKAKILTLVKPTGDDQNVIQANKETLDAIKADLKTTHENLVEAVKELVKINSALQSTNNSSSDDSDND